MLADGLLRQSRMARYGSCPLAFALVSNLLADLTAFGTRASMNNAKKLQQLAINLLNQQSLLCQLSDPWLITTYLSVFTHSFIYLFIYLFTI